MIKNLFIFTLIIFVISCKQSKNGSVQTKPVKLAAFLLYENFDTALLNCAVTEATSFYHCKAIVIDPRPLPAFALYKPRQRYKADSLLVYQSSIIPAGAETLIGLTQKDISTSLGEKKDWGIFGLGYQPGNACVISVCRLRATTYDQYKQRFIKVLLHELGHNQGLPHCSFDPFCLMNDAKGSIATVDKERKWLCSNCRKQLYN